VIPTKIKTQILQKSQNDGAVGFNRRKGYHLEFALASAQEARDICEEFAANDVFGHIRETGNEYRVYVKDSESICNLLALVGANKSLLNLHNEIAMRQAVNLSNRRANCDSANIERQIETARAQIEIFDAIRQSKRYETLEKSLREVIDARLKNPSAAYDELAKILGISKSGLVHRLKKLLS
jgi:DNA-binding protein WhiA